MKKLYLIFALIIGTALIGCTSEDPATDYYIKYVVKSIQPYNINSVTVATDNGVKTLRFKNTLSWEQTYGPVAKGFKASIKVDALTSTVEIHCCRGKEPFALKAIKNGQASSPSLEYTIDY